METKTRASLKGPGPGARPTRPGGPTRPGVPETRVGGPGPKPRAVPGTRARGPFPSHALVPEVPQEILLDPWLRQLPAPTRSSAIVGEIATSEGGRVKSRFKTFTALELFRYLGVDTDFWERLDEGGSMEEAALMDMAIGASSAFVLAALELSVMGALSESVLATGGGEAVPFRPDAPASDDSSDASSD